MSVHKVRTVPTAIVFLILILGISLSSQGLCKSLLLQPEKVTCCPDQTVMFICSVSQVSEIVWTADPYLTGQNRISYFLNQEPSHPPSRHSGNFFSEVTNITRLDEFTALFMETTIETNCSAIDDGTIVYCIVRSLTNSSQVSATVYHADVPHIMTQYYGRQIISLKNLSIAVLELGEMFDGGGVPIDHYIIQLDNGTQLETADSTYSFDIMYNTTLSVNISAHNCAGYSPFFLLVIQYGPDGVVYGIVSMEDDNITNGTSDPITTDDNVTNPTPMDNTTSEKSPSFQNTLLLPVAIGSFLFLVFLLVVTVSLFNVWRCVKKRSTKIAAFSTTRLENNGNGELSSDGTSTLPLYSYVTVTRDTTDRDCTGQYRTVVSGGSDTSQNFIGMYAELKPTGTYAKLEQPQPSSLPPPPVGNDIVEYATPDVSKLKERERTEEEEEEEEKQENIDPEAVKSDLHPLDKEINAHLILLQLVSVRPSWYALGQSAGVDIETLDSIDKELSDDGGKLAEVVFYWVERMRVVCWSDVAQLCEQIGFNHISEALNNAYITGVLPVQDSPIVDLSTSDATPPPTLPPRVSNDDRSPPVPPHQGRRKNKAYQRDTDIPPHEIEDDEGSPQPPPLPPPLAPADIDF